MDSIATATMLMPTISKGASLVDDIMAMQANFRASNPMTNLLTGGACFVAGTQVLTENGLERIESIEAGDMVWASNPDTGETALKKVVRTYVRDADTLVHLHVGTDEIKATPEHPFYVPQKGWTAAIELRDGDVLVLSNGEYVVVEKVQHEILETPVKVYNFEVQDFHTYFVGEHSVLVHNTCGVHTPDKRALLQLGREMQIRAKSGRVMSLEEARILDSWAVEYGIPQHHQAYLGSGQHWVVGWDHTHLYNQHIPFSGR